VLSLNPAHAVVASYRQAVTWQDYQQEVASFFEGLGCTVQVEAEVQGIRTRHKIDVWAISTRFGLFTRWVVECKLWQAAVPKEKVFALRTIVDDVGADRGFLIAEGGFQSGAIEAAESTNITLVTLAELRASAEDDLQMLRLEATGRNLQRLSMRCFELRYSVKDGSRITSTPRKGYILEGDTRTQSRVPGTLYLLSEAIARAKEGITPRVVGWTPDGTGIAVRTVGEMLDFADKAIEYAEAWLAMQEQAIAAAGGWDEPPRSVRRRSPRRERWPLRSYAYPPGLRHLSTSCDTLA
jgi:hypothetical protein